MTMEGAKIIRTGFSRESGYDKIFLKTVDGKILVLQVGTTSDDDTCIGISDVTNSLKKRIKKCKEDIKEYEEQLEEMKKWQ